MTKDVSAAVSFRTGLPTPGQSPDRSLLKLDYRFRPRWAIETTLGEQVAVSGIINAERGWVEVQGRRFSVERATGSFDPDRPPSDPTIAATALYVAPDSTRVYADFIGSVANGRLKLRSEPALTQSEILSLVVFGQRERATVQSGQKTSGANRAASLGGGVVTQGLNKALSDISPVEITTRIDTYMGQC